ncbi:MAG: hypothetical protein ACQXXF_07135 [Thermoplasmatota archaeon]|jgi:hypothetical protein
MKKEVVLFITILLTCINISNSFASGEINSTSNKIINNLNQDFETKHSSKETMKIVKNTVEDFLKINESLYKSTEKTNLFSPQPLLGGNEIFGLWINVIYNGQSFQKQVSITPQMIRGKLSDPKYRTPISFDVDGDMVPEIETGFGFYKYGIDEILPDGSTKNHPAWATAFDFMQIGDCLDDQTAELEVWQEFHVNLDVLVSKSKSVSPGIINIIRVLIERFSQKLSNFVLLNNFLNKLLNNYPGETTEVEPKNNIGNLAAEKDYIVTRVGYRSPAGQKIPMKFEKTFAVGKSNIFRPAIFQHEMNPNDVIGTASNDIMFGFQAFKEGMTDPSYNIEFCINFNPASYLVTQLIPLSGKTLFYYHRASIEPTEITFSSNLLKGGSTAEEENSTFSLTLSLDSIPNDLIGPGKYMAFDLNMIGDQNPIGGNFVYYASHQFNVGVKLTSPWFEQSIVLKKIPTFAEFKWDLDTDITIVQNKLVKVDTVGFASLTMNKDLGEIKILYPKADPVKKDVTWISVKDIPSSRKIEACASLEINNGSMLQIDAMGYVQHDLSSSIGDITVFYPKPDPDNNPDMVFFQIPRGSFANHGRTSIQGRLYVDPDPDNFFVNPDNYFYAKAERTASSDFGEANFYLPNIEVPLLKIYNIPGNAYGMGNFSWNQLKGRLFAERTSSSGQKDPIKLTLVFDDLQISNQLSIGNGFIDMQGKIGKNGYFKFDTADDLLDNAFHISNLATGTSLSISAASIAADDFSADWALDTSGPQLKVEDLDLSGSLNLFENFNVNIALTGKTTHFTGNWAVGESGGFQIDFYQAEPTQINFSLNEKIENFKFYGYVVISQHIHFDLSWKWVQGAGPSDYGFFAINDNTNSANILAILINATYKDRFGVDIKIVNASLYFKLKWYKEPGQWLPHAWLEYYVGGSIDHVYLLWEYQWYTIVT